MKNGTKQKYRKFYTMFDDFLNANQDKDVYVYLRKHIIIDKKQTKSRLNKSKL